ncbi:MAG: hypothetical protein PHC64_08160, partial [Candidatus Gastranaerophilales bacterium]|nr:hypothetical protein [Candidatus Gastranaerophilales bacterium]
ISAERNRVQREISYMQDDLARCSSIWNNAIEVVGQSVSNSLANAQTSIMMQLGMAGMNGNNPILGIQNQEIPPQIQMELQRQMMAIAKAQEGWTTIMSVQKKQIEKTFGKVDNLALRELEQKERDLDFRQQAIQAELQVLTEEEKSYDELMKAEAKSAAPKFGVG